MDTRVQDRLRDYFLLAGGAILFVYILVRAWTVSMIADECGTYSMFVTPGHIFPETYDYFSANNHSLNTALMMLCEKLFGSHQFSLRLPNVLAGVLYIFSTAMMVRRLRPPLLAVCAFLVLNTNPFMVQYFSMARGYGIACGLMTFSFWQLWVYLDEGYRMRNLLPAVVAAALAVFANYTYLNLYLPAMGMVALLAFFQPGKTGSLRLLQQRSPYLRITRT